MEAALARLLDPCMGDPGDIWLKNWCCCSITIIIISITRYSREAAWVSQSIQSRLEGD